MTKTLKHRQLFWIFEIILFSTIGILYYFSPDAHPQTLVSFLFLTVYIFAHFSILGLLLLPSMTILINFIFKRKPQLIPIAFSSLLSLGSTFLIADSIVFNQYKFHINFSMLDLFLNGKGQIIKISTTDYLLFGVLFLFGFFVHRGLIKTSEKMGNFQIRTLPLSISIICFFLFSQIWHMLADGLYYRPITSVATQLPLAAPLVDQELLNRFGLVDTKKFRLRSLADNENIARGKVTALDYPKNPMNCPEILEKKLNILIILVDSLRADMLSPDIMPESTHFSEKGLRWRQHLSGSNATRGGVFSIFYGLPPTYFPTFLGEKKEPVLMAELRKLKYEMGIFASAPLTRPEFDQTVFSQVKDLRLQSQATEVLARDQEIVEEWKKFLDRRTNSKQPFFGFLFFDGPHEFGVDKTQLKFLPSL